MAIERRMLLLVGPKRPRHEQDDDYDRRRACFRLALAAVWWGSLASTICSSLAVGFVSGIAFALIPWAVWFGAIALVGAVTTLALIP